MTYSTCDRGTSRMMCTVASQRLSSHAAQAMHAD